MEILKGIGVSSGVAICSAVVLDAEEYRISQRQVQPQQTRAEVQRLRKAFASADDEVNGLQLTQGDIWDSDIKDIFAVHLHFLRDRTLRRKIGELIVERNYTAEYAVSVILRDIAKPLAQSDDRYLSARVNDIYDIERRLLRLLIGQRREDLTHLQEPVIVVSHDITPTETAAFDLKFVKGIATEAGGRTSHSAIVARSLGIPAVVALGDVVSHLAAGDTIIVDGNRATVIIDPDPATIEEYKQYARDIVVHEHELDELIHLPAETTDKELITLLGNIEFPHEVDMVIHRGGDGIGLYRTEFLYLEADHEPSEEEHYQAYTDTIRSMAGGPVVIRTMDLGADKFTQGRRHIREPNPFLGLRSIRFCLQNLPLFKTQMRAILRAAAHGRGNVKIMFPLITNLIEIRQAKWILADIKEDLEEQGIEFDEHLSVGIMIETPAAALIADELAEEVDFFSIGTNDLVQYTLAVDRVNELVAPLYNPTHPAVLQLMRKVQQSAKRAKIDVSICGEMASDPELVPLLLGMGFTSLSLAPPMIPEVKKIIRMVSMEHCKRLASKALSLTSAKEITSYLRSEMQELYPESA